MRAAGAARRAIDDAGEIGRRCAELAVDPERALQAIAAVRLATSAARRALERERPGAARR